MRKLKKKKFLEISFYTSAPKTMITCCTVPEIWCVTNVIFIFHFGLIFASLPCWKPENSEFLKMKKKHPEISSLKTCTTNYDQIMYSSWDMVWKGRTDGQMDGKSDILRWVPHLKPFSWFESKLSKTSFSKGGIRPPPTLLGYSSALVSNKAALLLKPFE